MKKTGDLLMIKNLKMFVLMFHIFKLVKKKVTSFSLSV